MKLLFCSACESLFKLTKRAGTCDCGKTSGAYKQDGDTTWIKGDYASLLGLSNVEFVKMFLGTTERAGLYLYPMDNGKIEVVP